jgi:hypothetical protein
MAGLPRSFYDPLRLGLGAGPVQLTGVRIAGEYDLKIKPIILSRDEMGLEKFVLSHWMLYCPRKMVLTDEADQSMGRIRKEIHDHEPGLDQQFIGGADRGIVQFHRAANQQLSFFNCQGMQFQQNIIEAHRTTITRLNHHVGVESRG